LNDGAKNIIGHHESQIHYYPNDEIQGSKIAAILASICSIFEASLESVHEVVQRLTMPV
jgi:hypothetical protein